VKSSAWRIVERLAWIAGICLVAIWLAFTVVRLVGVRQDMARFGALRAAGRLETGHPDLTLWSSKRIKAWRDTLNQNGPGPLAVLRIPKIGVEVPVLEGTDDWTLNRAVGHISRTAAPGTDGNSAIAGHRDGFFRGLKNIETGDVVEIETVEGNEVYRIERIWIVNPEDVSVLDPTTTRAVTLVTCYPFYFIGSAPQRYIVRAMRVGSAATYPDTLE
jgi:sortase A